MFISVCHSSEGTPSSLEQAVEVDSGYTPRDRVQALAASVMEMLRTLFIELGKELQIWDLRDDLFGGIDSFLEQERERRRSHRPS